MQLCLGAAEARPPTRGEASASVATPEVTPAAATSEVIALDEQEAAVEDSEMERLQQEALSRLDRDPVMCLGSSVVKINITLEVSALALEVSVVSPLLSSMLSIIVFVTSQARSSGRLWIEPAGAALVLESLYPLWIPWSLPPSPIAVTWWQLKFHLLLIDMS